MVRLLVGLRVGVLGRRGGFLAGLLLLSQAVLRLRFYRYLMYREFHINVWVSIPTVRTTSIDDYPCTL